MGADVYCKRSNYLNGLKLGRFNRPVLPLVNEYYSDIIVIPELTGHGKALTVMSELNRKNAFDGGVEIAIHPGSVYQ